MIAFTVILSLCVGIAIAGPVMVIWVLSQERFDRDAERDRERW